MSLFPSFLFALKFDQLKSINIWKSKLKNSGKIILYKPCYNCKICNSVNVYELFFSLQYAMLVPAVVLFAFGILIYFCLIPSPDEIGEYKYLYKVVSHIEITFISWSEKIVSSKYSYLFFNLFVVILEVSRHKKLVSSSCAVLHASLKMLLVIMKTN